MAAAVVQSRKTYFSGTSGTLQFTSSVTAGNTLVVCVSGYAGNAPSVSDNVNGSYGTYLFLTTGGDGSLQLSQWRKYNCTGGTITVTFNAGSSGAYTSFTIIEISGVLTTDPVDVSDTNTATSTAVSAGPITPTQTGDILIANMTSMAGSTVTITPDADYTELQEYEDGASYMHMNVMYRVYNSTSADTANWTLGSSLGNIGGVVAYKESGAPPAGRTTYNTDARPLGINAGISRRVNIP